MGTTGQRVRRMLTAARHADARTSPEEVILRAAVEGRRRQDLISTLAHWPYTFGARADPPFEGATAGTWDQVRLAFLEGLLTEDEFETIRAAVSPPSAP